MMRCAAAAVLLCAAACAQQATPVPAQDEPHNKKIFDNGKVRAWVTEIAPGDAARLHRHERDYLAIDVTDNQFTSTTPGQPPRPEKSAAGHVRVGKAGTTHSVGND